MMFILTLIACNTQDSEAVEPPEAAPVAPEVAVESTDTRSQRDICLQYCNGNHTCISSCPQE